jgi:hypothetical protein
MYLSQEVWSLFSESKYIVKFYDAYIIYFIILYSYIRNSRMSFLHGYDFVIPDLFSMVYMVSRKQDFYPKLG